MKNDKSLEKIISDYFNKFSNSLEKLDKPKIIEAAKILFQAWKNNKIVYSVGCGGSASTATHFAADLAKTAIVPGKKRFKAISIVDNIPLVSAWTNDSGWASVFSEQLEPWLLQDDVLVVFSVHGGVEKGPIGPWSQNLVQAMNLARKRGVKIIGFSGFEGGAVGKMADVAIVVRQSQEPLATPIIESAHIALHHLLCCLILKEMVRKS